MPRPILIGIGVMKAGTSALHRYLDAHPDIAMSRPKELCFFYGDRPEDEDEDWSASGNWWRGLDWYRRHFPDDGRIGGEVSPGYTSPDHPEAASRMADVVPEARLVCLVRDPLERAISQYRHHAREGTEDRDLEAALLDPDSQYLSRSRYHERLQPFLEHFSPGQLLVIAQEHLESSRRQTLSRVQDHVGVRRHWSPAMDRRWHVAPDRGPDCPPEVALAFRQAVADDVARLRPLLDTDVAWCLPASRSPGTPATPRTARDAGRPATARAARRTRR